MLRTSLSIESLDDRIVPAHVGQANFGNLISALNNVAVAVDQINILNDVERIQIVTLEDVLNGNNVNALNNVLRNADIDILNDAINNNEVLKDFLNDANIAITDVVAVNVLSGGDFVVFTR